jgi:hypothetical protein
VGKHVNPDALRDLIEGRRCPEQLGVHVQGYVDGSRLGQAASPNSSTTRADDPFAWMTGDCANPSTLPGGRFGPHEASYLEDFKLFSVGRGRDNLCGG